MPAKKFTRLGLRTGQNLGRTFIEGENLTQLLSSLCNELRREEMLNINDNGITQLHERLKHQVGPGYRQHCITSLQHRVGLDNGCNTGHHHLCLNPSNKETVALGLICTPSENHGSGRKKSSVHPRHRFKQDIGS